MNSSENELKTEKPVYNPHDEAFKLAFRKLLLAISFFRNYLPGKIVKHIDFKKLEITNQSFVDEKLREKHSDIVYKTISKGRPCFLYIIFEHQSTPEYWMAYRLFGYIDSLWKEFRDQNPKAKNLPVVFTLVLYHGKKEWDSPMRLRDLVEGDDDFSEYIPDFTYHLCDLNDYNDEMLALGGEMALRVVLYLFKHIFDDDFEAMFRKTMDLLVAIEDQTIYLEFLEWVLRYTYHARNDSREDIEKVIDEETERIADERIRRHAMTIAEQYKEVGREEGREEGRIEGAAATLINLLHVRFGDISKALENKLGESDGDRLKEFGRSMFDFKDLNDAENWWGMQS